MNEPLPNSATCPACGGQLVAGSNGALCPACMLQAAIAGDPGAESLSPQDSRGEQPGARIGHYKLLKKIGEGGFGVVWMAEQEEPVRRRIALKIIKPGMDSSEVIARFEAERQALALMEHPNIASILDGGTTETGRPFFVMELVQGEPITSYCDANRLSTRERLALFAEVCHAVQHAHQKGVIHRDLKPSNILIAVKDGRAVPKVIDFGIAKATGSGLSGRTRVTRLNQWLGTPEYMSPEQAGLGGLDVDTRSDIYSLGVLFYELLAGHPPFDPATLRDVGYDAILRLIREEEPPKPSTRLNALTKDELGTVAENRGLDPARLHRQMRGDLDWIVMKALEKDRNRRYETANAFAQDIARFLADEPVAAGPPSVIYRMRKFVRRNRRVLWSGTAAAAALLAGLAVAGGIWLDSTFEKNQRVARAVDLIKQAERSLERSAVADFDNPRHFREARELDRRVEESLAGMSHPDDSTRERREQLRRAVATEERARRLVAAIEEIMMRDKASLQVAESRAQEKSQALAAAFADFGITPLDGQVADTVELLTTGRKTLQDRMLAGLTAWSNALEETNPEQSARLEDVIDRADTDPWRRELRQAIKAGDAAGLEALAERKEITEQPTMTVLQLSAVLEDKQLAGAVEKLLRRAQREAPESFWTNYILGETLAGAIDRAEGDDIRTRAVHTRGVNFGSDHPGLIPNKLQIRPEFGESIGFLRAAVAARPDAGAAWMTLGMMLTASGRLDDAIVTYQKAVSRFPEAGDFSVLLGQALLFRHRTEDALPHLRRAAERDPANQGTQFELGQALLEMGEYEEARAALLKAKLVDEEARGAKETGNTGEMKDSRGLTLLGIGITNSAEAAHLWVAMAQNTRGDFAKSLASTQLALDVNPDSTVAHCIRSMALMNQGELAAAKTSAERALKLEPDMTAAHNILGVVLMRGRDFEAAVASFRRAIELDPKDATAHCNLGDCLGALGAFQEAHSALATALKLTPEFPAGWTNLGAVLEAQDKPERALESYQKAVSLDPRANKALSGVARLLWKTGKHEESIAAHRQLNDAEAYLWLSTSLIKEERIEDAIDVLQRAVALKPDFAAAHHDLGAVYIRAERHADAIKSFRTAIQLAPGMASAHHQLGVVLLYQNDYEAAVASSLKAVELAPDAAQFKDALLSALLSSGRITAAGLVHGDCDSPDCIISAMLEKDRQLRKIFANEGPGAPAIPALLGDQSKDFFRMTFSSIIRRPYTADDLRAAWDARREEVAKLLASVTVRIIQIRKAGDDEHPEANEVDSRALAEGILQKLTEGGDFAELAEKHSQGWAEGKPETVAHGDLSTELNAAAFSLKDGDFTRKPIEDKHGFYLLKVESRQAGENADIESPKVQEIIEATLAQQRRTDWERRYLARVRDPAPDLATARAQFIAGQALRVAGEFSRAADLIQQALAVQTEKLGTEDPETLKVMKNLATSYFQADRFDEALKLGERILPLLHKVNGMEHPETLGAMNNLALFYFQAGRIDEALKLREEVLPLCHKVLGPEHPDTLTAMSNLAASYSDAGRHDQALKIQEAVLPLCRKVRGPEHPDTLTAMHNLALSYHNDGHRDEALKLCEEVLLLRRKVNGPEHTETLTAMNNMAESYSAAGRHDEAIKLKEEYEAIRRKVKATEHPANSDAAAGRRDEALKLQKEANQPPASPRSEFDEAKAKAEQGDASAQNDLGVYYIHGRGVAKDEPKAAEWFRKAADQGHAAAQFNLGICFKKGEGVARDASEAAKWIRKSAEQGNAEAQCEIGFCYYYGNGVDKNYATALEWYHKSAAQNFAGAQHNLGICYRDGLAVKQDEVETVKWFRLAAEQNAPLAQNALGFRYFTGRGVPQDYGEAVRLYRLAAARNCAEAQYGLACCYVNGLGVEQDPVEAYKWMLLAAAQGFAPAKQDGVRMERDLTPEQVAEARKRASLSPAEQVVTKVAPAKPPASDEFDTKKFEEYQAKAEQGNATAQALLGRCYATGQGAAQNPTAAVKWFRLSADQGDARGECGLGTCYSMGMGVAKDAAEAVKWYRKAANQGDAGAQANLGVCYCQGAGVGKNTAEAVNWFRKAAEQGHANGQADLGGCYYLGLGVEQNYVEAVKWSRKAAEQGHATAQFKLGDCYLNGEGVERDLAEAAKWYRKAAGQNNIGAQYKLGLCYRDGVGLQQDLAEAVKWLRKSAEQNNTDAQYNLGVHFRDGPGQEQDLAEAAKWFRRAAERNCGKAQYNLGVLYLDGQGVARDDVEAAKWIHKAAEQGFAAAQSNLGMLYGTGRGVSRNLIESAKWYRKSADQGYAPGQYNLALCYQNGQGVAENPAESVKWYRKAAEQNLAMAQVNLGGFYLDGQGVEKDEVEGYKWTLLAAAQGEEVAQGNMPGLERRLSPEQLADGQKRAGEMKLPESPPPDLPQGHPLAGLSAKANAGDVAALYALGEAFFVGDDKVPKNPAAAVRLFRKAAVQNHPAAQTMLGICYERGAGVAKYQAEAYRWYLLAAAQGDKKAKDHASALLPLLLESQIAEARQRVDQFSEKTHKSTRENSDAR